MRLPRLRVRTLMAVVVVVALLIWGGMMGSRSYDFHRRSVMYAEQERGWREVAASKELNPEFARECVSYFDGLTAKYRRATWRPWMSVEPDPWAPGAEAYYRQEMEKARRKEAIPGTSPVQEN